MTQIAETAGSADALVRCESCGQHDSGRFCSNCGRELAARRRPLLSFLETFVKLGDKKEYLRTYAYIMRSPTKRTLELFERRDAAGAYRFVEISVFLYAVLALSRVLKVENGVLADLVPVFSVLVSWSIYLTILYRLARRRSPFDRTFTDMLIVSALSQGIILPPLAIASFVQYSVSLALGTLLMYVLLVPTMVYSIRVWKRFWGLSGWRVFGYLCVGAFAGGFVSLLLTLPFAAPA